MTAPAKFQILFTKDAGAEIAQLDNSIKSRLKTILEKKVAVDPEGYGTPLRSPLTNYHKLEFAQHRVVYRIVENHKAVVVCSIGPRKAGDVEDVYKQLEPAIKTGKLAAQLKNVLDKIRGAAA
jgi:mRNA-degrading endonuclease RelE of RelBE toxin-antitoxin system